MLFSTTMHGINRITNHPQFEIKGFVRHRRNIKATPSNTRVGLVESDKGGDVAGAGVGKYLHVFFERPTRIRSP
jgi:hypothetical protein